MRIVGICAGGHDTSAALVENGEVSFAITEERLDRVKHSKAFPWLSIQACLDFGGLKPSDIDAFVFGWNFERFVKELYLKPALRDISHFEYIRRDSRKLDDFLHFEDHVRERLNYQGVIEHFNHHDCHIAYAFHTSGFSEANFLSIDGYGEKETTVVGHAERGSKEIFDVHNFPNSLGLAYAALTHYLGFKHHCDEGIVMGLASYGDPKATAPGTGRSYESIFDEIIQVDESGRFQINYEWLTLGLMKGRWVTEKMVETFGSIRKPDSELTQHHMNIAAALQRQVERAVLSLSKAAYDRVQCSNICLSGGVALNCVANTKLLLSGPYKDVYIPSAPGDNGVAVGAAILAYLKRNPGSQISSLREVIGLGPVYSDKEILSAIETAGLQAERPQDLVSQVASLLVDGKIVGWYQGRSEFGPRALGRRSILTRPFPAEMKDYLNAKVKFREYFRPFAPVVLEEKAGEYFQMDIKSPYMMHAFPVKETVKNSIAATVHVDGTCRVQTVSRDSLPQFYALIEEFEKQTGIPVILNTSFNIKGQPIVETPLEAVRTFQKTNIDALVLEGYLIKK